MKVCCQRQRTTSSPAFPRLYSACRSQDATNRSMIPNKKLTYRMRRLAHIPAIPHLRFLPGCIVNSSSVFNLQHSILSSSKIKCCVDQLNSPSFSVFGLDLIFVTAKRRLPAGIPCDCRSPTSTAIASVPHWILSSSNASVLSLLAARSRPTCAWRVWRCAGMLRPGRSEYRVAFVKLATGQSK